MIAIDMLVAGPMMRHIVTHLPSMDEAQFERVKAMCVSLGEVLVRPLAEALSVEERATHARAADGDSDRVRRRRAAHDRAAEELAERGGPADGDLPDARVRRQRRAARPDRAAGRQRAAGSARSGARDPQHRHRKSVPGARAGAGQRQRRFARSDHAVAQRLARRTRHAAVRLHPAPRRSPGPLAAVYLRAIESLGALRDPEAIEPLKEALYKGEWWAPRRSASAAPAAAAALARIGTPEAQRRARRGGRQRSRAACARSSARSCRRAAARAREREAPHDRAAPAARRRAAAPLRRRAALGAALLEGPPDHRAQPRSALGGRAAAARPRSRASSSASIGDEVDRRRHADRRRPTRWGR